MIKTIHSKAYKQLLSWLKAYKQLLSWLKACREEKGLTIRQLAEQISVHHSIVWNIENAERRLNVMEYVQYCQQLEVDPMIGIKILNEER